MVERTTALPASCFCLKGEFWRCTDDECPNSGANAIDEEEDLPDAE